MSVDTYMCIFTAVISTPFCKRRTYQTFSEQNEHNEAREWTKQKNLGTCIIYIVTIVKMQSAEKVLKKLLIY